MPTFSDFAGAAQPSSSHNLIGVGGGLINGVNGNKVGITNPQLLPLANYGGPTQTMPPASNSPAIDAGANSLIPSGFTTDQRGFPRIVGKSVDIGAVEFSQLIITGSVFNDVNGDGVRQSSDPGLANWQVFVDLKNFGYYVTGDPVATTNSAGSYTLSFSPLTVTGNVIVREVRQNGWNRTKPSGAYPLGYYQINSAMGSASNITFGNHRMR